MFTHQHYELLAELIGKSNSLTEFTVKLVAELKTDNPRFDSERFIRRIRHYSCSEKVQET